MTDRKSARLSLLYIVGIFLLFAGSFFLLGLQSIITGIGILLLSMLLITWSNNNWKLKLLSIIPAATLIVFTLSNSYSSPEKYLIPEGFEGDIYVVFNQESGQKKEWDGLTRVYRIPDSGILFTQFKENQSSLGSNEHFSISTTGTLTKIGEFYDLPTTPVSKDSIVVFGPATFNPVSAAGLHFNMLAIHPISKMKAKTIGYFMNSRVDSIGKHLQRIKPLPNSQQ